MNRGKVYGLVPKRCPKCNEKMRSERYIGTSGMLMEKHTCPACGHVVDRGIRKAHFPDRDQI